MHRVFTPVVGLASNWLQMVAGRPEASTANLVPVCAWQADAIPPFFAATPSVLLYCLPVCISSACCLLTDLHHEFLYFLYLMSGFRWWLFACEVAVGEYPPSHSLAAF